MDKTPLVSVVIPVYNHEEYVEAALDSVFNQTYPKIEIIIIDDGSKDKSAQVVNDYVEKKKGSSRSITFIKQTNQGAHATLNQGLELAKGEVLTILNSDDYFALDRVEKMVQKMQAVGAEVAFSGVVGIDEKGRFLTSEHPWRQWYDKEIASLAFAASFSNALLKQNFAVSTGNFFFTSEIFKKLGGFNPYILAHDYDFLLRACLIVEPLYVEEELYYYRMHSSNTINLRSALLNDEIADIYSKFLLSIYSLKPKNPLLASPWKNDSAFSEIRRSLCLDQYLSNHVSSACLGPVPKESISESSPSFQQTGQNVMLVTHELSFTGAPKVVYDLAIMLKSRGYRPSILSLKNGPLAEAFEKASIPLNVIPESWQPSLQRSKIRKMTALMSLSFYLLLKVKQKVILNSTASFDVGFILGFFPFLKRFWYIHESYAPITMIPKRLFSVVLKMFSSPSKFTFIFGSKSTASIWARSEIQGAQVYWSGINANQISDKKPPSSIKNILSVGSIEVRKGTHTLIEAFIQCVKEKKIPEDVVLTLIGFPNEIKSSYQGDIILKVFLSGLQDRIILKKIIPPESLDAYYNQADLFVMASSNECLPLVLLQAMSKGVPVITTTAYGCAEAIEDGVTGYTCPTHNPNALAEAIAKAINHKEKTFEMGKKAQEKFNKQFSLEKNTSDFISVLEG